MDYQDDYTQPYQTPPANQSWVETDAGNPVSTEKNWWPTCLIGCLGIFVVLMILSGVAGYFAVKKGPAMAAKFVRTQAVDQIRSSDLPAEEKDELIRQLDRVVVAFENGELDSSDIERVGKAIAKSPIIVAGVVMGVEEKYLKPSGLTDEEKADAKRTMQRVWRGCIEEKIDVEDLQSAFEIIAEKKSENQWKLKSTLTDEELREFFATVKDAADEHEIPDEEFEVRVSKEVRHLVDELLDEDTSGSYEEAMEENDSSSEILGGEIPDESRLEAEATAN